MEVPFTPLSYLVSILIEQIPNELIDNILFQKYLEFRAIIDCPK